MLYASDVVESKFGRVRLSRGTHKSRTHYEKIEIATFDCVHAGNADPFFAGCSCLRPQSTRLHSSHNIVDCRTTALRHRIRRQMKFSLTLVSFLERRDLAIRDNP